MAEFLQIERSTYSKIESGQTEITLFVLEKIAQILEVEISQLLNLHNTYNNNVSNNTFTLSAQGINATLNLNFSEENIEELLKLFQKNRNENTQL